MKDLTKGEIAAALANPGPPKVLVLSKALMMAQR